MRTVDVRRMKRSPTHPGKILAEEFLSPLDLTQAEAARRMKISTNRLNELIRGKRGVTAATAIRLANLLGTSPELWLNLQMAWDLWHAYEAEGRQGRRERRDGTVDPSGVGGGASSG